MSRVSVVTDSTSYLPPALIERHGIHVVPLYVVFGGDRPVPEVEITDYPAFFEELRTAAKLPTTSQPSVGDFTAASDTCARLVERCYGIFGCEPTIVSEIGPVLAAHTGPGLLGVGAVPTRFLG